MSSNFQSTSTSDVSGNKYFTRNSPQNIKNCQLATIEEFEERMLDSTYPNNVRYKIFLIGFNDIIPSLRFLNDHFQIFL